MADAAGEGGFLGVARSLSGKRWLERPADDRQALAMAQRLDLPEIVGRHCPEGVDLVVDLVGGETLASSYALVKRGGRLVSLTAEPDGAVAAERGISAHSQFVEPSGDQLEQIARMFDAQQLQTRVQKIYPLNKAAEAHRVVEQGHVKGKLVLNL